MDFSYYLATMLTIDGLSASLIVVFVGAICVFLTSFGQRGDVALIFAPFLVLGGLLGNLIYQLHGFAIHQDSATNVAIITSAGVFAMLILLVISGAIITKIRERLFARRRQGVAGQYISKNSQ